MLTSAEEEFNNQVDMMTHYVASWPLFPTIFAIAQWARERNGYGGRDGSYAWGQQHEVPLTRTDLATAAAE